MPIFNFLSLIWIQFYLYFHPAGYVLCMSDTCMYITCPLHISFIKSIFLTIRRLSLTLSDPKFCFLYFSYFCRLQLEGNRYREFVVLNITFVFKACIQHFYSTFFISLPKTTKNLCCHPSLNFWERSILYEHVWSCLISTMAIIYTKLVRIFLAFCNLLTCFTVDTFLYNCRSEHISCIFHMLQTYVLGIV